MIDILLIAVGMIGLTIATAVDIKKREVPDWVSYSMIASGFGLRFIEAATTREWSYLLYGAIGFGAMFLIGMLMYYTRQWGGGDTKLIMGLGVIFATVGKEKLFLLDLFVNLLVVGAAYGIVYGMILAAKRWKEFRAEMRNVMMKNRKVRILAILAGAAALALMLFIKDDATKIILGITALFSLLYIYLITFMKAVENACMYKQVDVEKLVEGDWVAEEVKVNNKVICGPKDLGLEKHQIGELKKARVKKVLVKEGIPFVPSFFIATVVTLTVGNIILRAI